MFLGNIILELMYLEIFCPLSQFFKTSSLTNNALKIGQAKLEMDLGEKLEYV